MFLMNFSLETTTKKTTTTITTTTTVTTTTTSKTTSFFDEEIIPVIAPKTHTYLDILRERKKIKKTNISGNYSLQK